MAYNLQPLITILQQILNPQQTRWIVDHNKSQLQSLLQKSVSLQQILEQSSPPKIESLESKIRDAAHKAEDTIESHMVDQMLSSPGTVSFTFSTPDLQQVLQKFDFVMDLVVKLGSSNSVVVGLDENLLQLNDQVTGIQSKLEIIPIVGMGPIGQTTLNDLQQVMQQVNYAMKQVVKLMEEETTSTGKSGAPSVSHDSVVVGVDEDLRKLKEWLVGGQSKLEVVPIVGMGGIGKTTLARNLYNDPLIVEHFTCLAWTTISQDYDMQAILLGLLRCIIGKEVDQHIQKKNNHLRDILYQSLFGRRYMIVLDDIWSTTFWDEIWRYFPNNNNGSRIVITTRESVVAKDVNSQGKQHEMKLLNKSESWNLLRQEVFGEKDCPAALESTGRSIASNCGGLPLAIHVIGGLLSEANTTQEFWENVANDVGAAVGENDEFSDILSLSYNHLPSHLRPCFLYMGAFPEDHEIKASRLIRLWVAEGFLKSSGAKSLEEEAEDCLKALVGRNLVSVRALKSNGRPKRYGIHDLMRDLCLKKAEGQRFIHVKNKQVGEVKAESMYYRLRRVSVHPSYRIRDMYASTEFMSFARSFLCTGSASRAILSSVFFALRLLRVLDILEIKFVQFPTEILHIVNLRYLALYCSPGELPSEISRLCNLQTLVVCSSLRYVSLPAEIWQMAELRHLKICTATIFCGGHGFIQEKLQTISTIYNPSEGFLHRIPNIKNLRIEISDSSLGLDHLHKLETLKVFGYQDDASLSLSGLRLPPSLRKLSLKNCVLVGEFMKYLCELPNLEFLKLEECKFEGGEWDATQNEFCKLHFLLLETVQLVHWQADETNFPTLRHLVIRGCSALEVIPSGIGEIPTLQTIELHECTPSLVASAELIIEEQRENGNYDLQLRT